LERADREGHNEHTANIEQIMTAHSRLMNFVEGLAHQCAEIFKSLSSRIVALEADGIPRLPVPPSYPH
jgi:hypothetical protein